MLRKYLFLFILVTPFFSIGQIDTAAILKYKVKARNAAYEIFPIDNYLFSDCRNKIKIISKGSRKIIDLKLSSGRITKSNNDSVYYIDRLIWENTLLSIYETSRDGNEKAVLNKRYTIVPYPKIKFSGVKSDSVIGKLLLLGGEMYSEYKKIDLNSKVISFKMDILNKGEFIQDSSSTGHLTQNMRNYVNTLPSGSIIYFKDIKYFGSDGKLKTEAIFRLFLIDEEKNYLFGL